MAAKKEKRPIHTVEVLGKCMLTPHMLRITLGGPGLDGFPVDQDGAYVKLRFKEPESEDEKLVQRTYTVRTRDAEKHALDVDFVTHEASGPATDWANSCKVGDQIRFAGPGPRRFVDTSADWVFLAGDMSALPAISANIKAMPPHVRGYAVLEVISEADQQPLSFPDGLKVRWVINPEPEKANTLLCDAVKALPWLEGRPSVWVASEFDQSRAMRAYFKNERGVQRTEMYASSYWRMGEDDEGHRVAKRAAAMADEQT